jgi:hypothetical protein
VDLKSGVEQSRELIHSGLALEKFRQWATIQANADRNSLNRSRKIASRLDVPDPILAS